MMSLEVAELQGSYVCESLLAILWHQKRFAHLGKVIVDMTKSIDTITEIIRNPKHSFRKADDRPVKAQKHRYERRKIREFLKLGDWVQD
jgi:hypothetical protein